MTTVQRPAGELLPAPLAFVPIPYRIIALTQERDRLFACPPEYLATEILTTGFRCSGCGACCTRAVNGHIFLLDHDVETVKETDPGSCVPAPDPEFCDQNGVLYVSGFALRMRDDAAGSCWFLDGKRCRIYDNRFLACRIYPYMLRRSADAGGNIAWRTFSRRNGHGTYGQSLTWEEALGYARLVREYENAVLTHQISFLETIDGYFLLHKLRHDPGVYRESSRRYSRGRPVDIRVFHAGELEEYRDSSQPPRSPS